MDIPKCCICDTLAFDGKTSKVMLHIEGKDYCYRPCGIALILYLDR